MPQLKFDIGSDDKIFPVDKPQESDSLPLNPPNLNPAVLQKHSGTRTPGENAARSDQSSSLEFDQADLLCNPASANKLIEAE